MSEIDWKKECEKLYEAASWAYEAGCGGSGYAASRSNLLNVLEEARKLIYAEEIEADRIAEEGESK